MLAACLDRIFEELRLARRRGNTCRLTSATSWRRTRTTAPTSRRRNGGARAAGWGVKGGFGSEGRVEPQVHGRRGLAGCQLRERLAQRRSAAPASEQSKPIPLGDPRALLKGGGAVRYGFLRARGSATSCCNVAADGAVAASSPTSCIRRFGLGTPSRASTTTTTGSGMSGTRVAGLSRRRRCQRTSTATRCRGSRRP